MSAVLTANDSTFSETVSGDGVTVIDFWAEWCGPCRVFAPVFAASAASNEDVRHVKVDVDESPEVAQAFGIMSIPTTVILKDGAPVAAISGAMPAAQLQALINEAR